MTVTKTGRCGMTHTTRVARVEPPTDAVALTAIRKLPHGGFRQYTATTFPNGPWRGAEWMTRRAWCIGYLVACCDRECGCVGLLDAVNDAGDVVESWCIPTPAGDGLVVPHAQPAGRTHPHRRCPVTLRILSLGAGVQSTTLLLLAGEKVAPFDAAIFADTGWEPRAVYEHLDRLEAHAAERGSPAVYRVSAGNIRDDALDPAHRFASLPLYVRNPDGSEGMARRQCTAEYKVRPIKRKVREILGYPPPARVPDGVFVDEAIGISVDEIGRMRDSDVRYMRHIYPLIDIGWSRRDCERYLAAHGWTVTKSACVGCPFHGNRQWRTMRDERPVEWADVVEFDHAIRAGSARANATGQELRGSAYLHRSRMPLDQAPIDRVTWAEWRGRQGDLFDEAGDPDGCSPFTCRSGEPAAAGGVL